MSSANNIIFRSKWPTRLFAEEHSRKSDAKPEPFAGRWVQWTLVQANRNQWFADLIQSGRWPKTVSSMKHMEWGADHGLEIGSDFRWNVWKQRPGSLMYGANAIGGVIDLKQISTPLREQFGRRCVAIHKPIISCLELRQNFTNDLIALIWKSATFIYSDYRIPADSITYMTYNINLKISDYAYCRARDSSGNITLQVIWTTYFLPI